MTNEELKKGYNITFSFDFIDNVDNVLKNIDVTKKSFSKSVTYTLYLSEDISNRVLRGIMMATFNQAKIEVIETEVEMPEVGTDKPLGSKSAIDEN